LFWNPNAVRCQSNRGYERVTVAIFLPYGKVMGEIPYIFMEIRFQLF